MNSAMKTLTQGFVLVAISLAFVGCSKSESSGGSGSKSYSFSASANGSIGLVTRELASAFNLIDAALSFPIPDMGSRPVGAGPTLCSSVICFTPTALSGVYYASGLLIQSSGNGMMAYFGQSEWSSITGSSSTYNFDVSTPVTNSGNLSCCGGTGDFDSENTYISDIAYMFGYLDATFTISGVTGNTNMNRAFTVRFVLADGAISGGVRGDLLLKDPTGGATFYWIDTSASAGGDVGAGTLVSTRPSTPVTMNTSVVNYTNPHGTTQGNQTIPVIYTGVAASGGGNFTINQTALNTAGKTYTYNFDKTKIVMFPTLLTADINMISTYTNMLQRIHLGGLPHSAQSSGVGNPSNTVLVVTGR